MEENLMKHIYQNLVTLAGQVDRQQVQLFFLILSLSLLLLGATAPAHGGGGAPGG